MADLQAQISDCMPSFQADMSVSEALDNMVDAFEDEARYGDIVMPAAEVSSYAALLRELRGAAFLMEIRLGIGVSSIAFAPANDDCL